MFHLQFLNEISPISLVKPSEEIGKFADQIEDLSSRAANERAKLLHKTGSGAYLAKIYILLHICRVRWRQMKSKSITKLILTFGD